jgi:putative transcriptional regulator
MIRWRLRVLMAEQNISNQKLSELSGLHRVTISKLKKPDELKQISGDTLNRLCNVLGCTPNDLMEFTSDGKNDSLAK